jgi:hypothetical protein
MCVSKEPAEILQLFATVDQLLHDRLMDDKLGGPLP